MGAFLRRVSAVRSGNRIDLDRKEVYVDVDVDVLDVNLV
jgi:hypothetical protein